MRANGPILATALATLTACTQFPDLDAVVSNEARRADYPVLIPAGGILARSQAGTITAETGAALRARAANLRARAALLRGQPIDEETRLRLAARLRRLGG